MALRGEERAKPAEAVGDYLSRGDKLGQSFLHLRAEEMRAVGNNVR